MCTSACESMYRWEKGSIEVDTTAQVRYRVNSPTPLASVSGALRYYVTSIRDQAQQEQTLHASFPVRRYRLVAGYIAVAVADVDVDVDIEAGVGTAAAPETHPQSSL